MSFKREKIRDIYLLTTEVENIFINEYMPQAPGDYVKVYLYGLLYSGNGEAMTEKQMSRQLGMPGEKIDQAWAYWERQGLVSRTPSDGTDGYDICFRQMRSLMYGRDMSAGAAREKTEEAEAAGVLGSDRLKNLLDEMENLLGKTFSPRETKEIFSWAEEIGATDDIILGAASYCAEKGKTGINYISKVIRQWTDDVLLTKKDIKEHLDKIEARSGLQRQILNSLGLNRGATAAEKEMIDRWFDQLHFNQERVMEACARASFISSPNLRYVNKVLENWYEEAKSSGRDVNTKITVTQADLNRYYEYLRNKAREEAEERKKEVYSRIPRIKEIDGEMMDLGRNLSKVILGGKPEKVEEIKKLLALLEEERAVLLTENNYRRDYTDIKFACEKCSDTGITEDGVRCSCVEERIGEAEIWQNSTSSKK